MNKDRAFSLIIVLLIGLFNLAVVTAGAEAEQSGRQGAPTGAKGSCHYSLEVVDGMLVTRQGLSSGETIIENTGIRVSEIPLQWQLQVAGGMRFDRYEDLLETMESLDEYRRTGS